ncbi:hypothetical protein M1437_01015 [Patescibacteria group bacterium]|nr:hypothetical protein [Patescibacteria group bacterium]
MVKYTILLLSIGVIAYFGFQTFLKQSPNNLNWIHQSEFKNIPPAKPYKSVITKPEGWFKTGQAADLILYADNFNNSGGPANLNHPMKVTSDGKRLIVSDTYNNRVLIWNSIPLQNYTPADLVLGQEDMTQNSPGTSPNKLRWPTGVTTDGTKLAVADAYNNRVLIWNQFPAKNGQPADVVIGQPDFSQNLEAMIDQVQITPSTRQKKHLWWPWDVMIKNGKLLVISLDGALLVWDSVPTANYQEAEMILGQGSFGERFAGDMKKEDPYLYMKTPRSVGFDGQNLVVGDYNAHTMFVWKNFPQNSGQKADFIYKAANMAKVATGVTLAKGNIYATMDSQIYVWTKPILNDNQQPDFMLGSRTQSNVASRQTLQSPYGLSSDGTHLFVADSNNNRVLIYNKLPTKSSDTPDVILGQKDFDTNRFVARNSRNNPVPVTDGNSLIVGDDYNGIVQIYKKLPDENLADADIFKIGAGRNTICAFDSQLYCTGSDGIMKWNSLPAQENQRPDFTLDQPSLKASGISVDQTNIYVHYSANAQVLIWSKDSFEKGKQQPDLTLSTKDSNSSFDPGKGIAQISTDGKHLAVADSNNSRILIWELPIQQNNQQPVLILGGRNLNPPPKLRFNLPQGVVVWQDRLFIADTGNHRVLIWSKFPKSINDLPDIVLGQKDLMGNLPSNAQDGLFQPYFMAFDGHYLWVGEFKWSDRLLRYSVSP